ncbi:hypothetical protein [Spartinivicinus poritis]|uniref:Endonuclease/exonuclease/phosphatase domain-containing protein n=1 Tax=Spartinivicinus poritis TaxID=2994640 RepID=A0ABT5UE28_9GAMM|nr:hypothetical protein [Spartinivicinus sp. A2-2]MDE1464445.1 hypothetical protein [Spartinivicinus sp. A2-2]
MYTTSVQNNFHHQSVGLNSSQNGVFQQAQAQHTAREPSQSPIKPVSQIDGAFRKQLEAATGPTRVGANAVIATQLDHLERVSKPSVISDHLPAVFQLSTSKGNLTASVASWNMLAEVHKNNNYENVAIDESTQALFNQGKLEYFSGRNNELSKAWLFSDLATEMANSTQFSQPKVLSSFYKGEMVGQQAFLKFLENEYKNADHAVLKPTRQHSAEEQIAHRTAAREAIISEMISSGSEGKSSIREDFYTTAVTTLKLYNTLNHGSISWANRKNTLENNQALLQKLAQNQVLTIQECTEPKWFVDQLNSKDSSKQFKFIDHKVGASSKNNDHCVVIYDSNKWQVKDTESDVQKFHLGRNKPAILLRLTEKTSLHNASKPLETMVIGSVHYPGGNDGKNHLTTVNEKLVALSVEENENIFVAGDFNQSKETLADKVNQLAGNYNENSEVNTNMLFSSFNVIEPASTGGTMAGPDWGREHEGEIIDIAFSNMNVSGSVVDMKYFV